MSQALKEKIEQIPYWYHKIKLPGGIVTPGWAPFIADAYRIPKDLTGKRVLDVGAWDGYWTFEAVKRGAREVVAIDDFSDMLNTESGCARSAWDTFDLCRKALGIPEGKIIRKEMSVYEAASLGKFDVIFFFGTLYHLRHPLLALEILSQICTESLHVETATLDDYSPYMGGMGHGYPDQMVCEFYPTGEYGDNVTNWFVPTLKTAVYWVQSCGWKNVRGWKLTKTPAEAAHCRGFVEAWR